jgi:mannose-6-phosphate isomerase-like protein (cupin superfamily)
MVDDYLNVYKRILEETKTEDRRPWGYYEVLSDFPDHKVKRIVVYPGKRLSLQSHHAVAELDDCKAAQSLPEAITDPVEPWRV